MTDESAAVQALKKVAFEPLTAATVSRALLFMLRYSFQTQSSAAAAPGKGDIKCVPMPMPLCLTMIPTMID